MTFHKRSEWAAGLGASCSDPYDGPGVKGVAIHWVGSALSDDLRRGVNSAVASFLRQCYAGNKADGYCDIEYSLAVDGKGDVWECRGLQYDTGANGTAAANDTFVSVLVIYPVGGKPTDAQVKGVRDAVARVRNKYSSANAIKPHQAFVATACPGPAALDLIKSGAFEPVSAREKRRNVLSRVIDRITDRIKYLRRRRENKRDKRKDL